MVLGRPYRKHASDKFLLRVTSDGSVQTKGMVFDIWFRREFLKTGFEDARCSAVRYTNKTGEKTNLQTGQSSLCGSKLECRRLSDRDELTLHSNCFEVHVSPRGTLAASAGTVA